MLKHGEVNPLNVFGLRRTEHCPPHFEKLIFDLRATDKIITDWVYENLAGRFFYGDYYYTHNGQSTLSKCIAFEEAGELSYFGLFLDTINVNSF
jgi:hypothetical protein